MKNVIKFWGIVSIVIAFGLSIYANVNSKGFNTGNKDGLNWGKVLEYVKTGSPEPDRKVEKTESEWRELLTAEQFRVTRQEGTERAFTGEHYNNYEPGIYSCVCCNTKLFNANDKFKSGTGWPSFTEPIADNVINYVGDNSHGMIRVEVECNVCNAHLGHVFNDGPKPTGLRYCINSVALTKNH